jgi:hypothetical protein
VGLLALEDEAGRGGGSVSLRLRWTAEQLNDIDFRQTQEAGEMMWRLYDIVVQHERYAKERAKETRDAGDRQAALFWHNRASVLTQMLLHAGALVEGK